MPWRYLRLLELVLQRYYAFLTSQIYHKKYYWIYFSWRAWHFWPIFLYLPLVSSSFLHEYRENYIFFFFKFCDIFPDLYICCSSYNSNCLPSLPLLKCILNFIRIIKKINFWFFRFFAISQFFTIIPYSRGGWDM